MPDATTGDGTLTVEKNGSLVWTVNRPMPEITLRVGRVAEQALQCKGRQIRLADLAEPGSALTLRVRSASGFNLIGKRCIS
jgi:hypothetical protein